MGEKHEFLTDEQKERRAQWQKRLQKGRSKNYNSLPTKARLRKNSSNNQNNSQKTDNHQVQSNTTSNSDENKVHLKAKLRLAVEAAGSQEGRTDDDGSVSPSFSAHRFKPVGGGKSGKNRGARRMQQPIQQPCQRGMN